MKKGKGKKIIWSIIGGSSILTIAVAMAILIAVLMIFDFFGTKLTKEKVQNNAEYADASLLVIKSDTILPKDAKWGLHFLENCHAECIGAVLNACI